MIELYVHQVPLKNRSPYLENLYSSGYPVDDMITMDNIINKYNRKHQPVKYGTSQEAHVLRLLRRVREGVLKPEDVRLFFYNPDSDTWDENRVTEDGDLADTRVPGGFFDWRVDELF